MNVPTELDARFRERAATEGLLDVAFDMAESPVGDLLVAATRSGVCRISFDAEPEAAIDELARAYGARVLRARRPLDQARRQLDEYFAGARRTFDLGLDLEAVPDFQRLVLTELALVPYGETATYGALAARIGRDRAARAVGGALNRNPIPIVLPCHRIVGSGGRLVGYGGGIERKRLLLDLEAGVVPLDG
jgi:methylated-DNA-[protein]-cysteine S-methyltransferase